MTEDSTPSVLDQVSIGPYRPGDERAILACFKKVFGVERNLAHWNWKFRENPAGTHIYLARLPSGQVLSQFCGLPARVQIGRREVIFGQIIDSMTDPEFRRGLKKPGLFASTCYAFVDFYGRPEREVIMYGLPNPPAYRIGSRLLGYSHLHDVVNQVRKRDELRDCPAEAGRFRVEEVDRFGPELDLLWGRVRHRYEVCLVRDSRYLNWRYAAAPDVKYLRLALKERDTGTLRGVAVVRGDFIGKPHAILCDWLVEAPEGEGTHFLARFVESRAKAAGVETLEVMLPENCPEAAFFGSIGYRPVPTQFILVARTYSPDVPLELLRDRWYYTAGDHDIS